MPTMGLACFCFRDASRQVYEMSAQVAVLLLIVVEPHSPVQH